MSDWLNTSVDTPGGPMSVNEALTAIQNAAGGANDPGIAQAIGNACSECQGHPSEPAPPNSWSIDQHKNFITQAYAATVTSNPDWSAGVRLLGHADTGGG